MQRSYFKLETNALGSNRSYWLFVFNYLFTIAQVLLPDVTNKISATVANRNDKIKSLLPVSDVSEPEFRTGGGPL